MASKYAESHVSPQGPGDARPTALQIVQDEGLEGKLRDRTFVITGCSSGIGVETARAISATRATIYLPVRDVARSTTALSGILEAGRVELIQMDLTSLASIRAAAAEILEKTQNRELNVLICNAGVMAVPTRSKTVDGFEMQFGTNHLGHFLLFNLLQAKLLASSTPSFPSRVVMVSSSGHRGGGIRPDDYNFDEENSYTPFGSYSQSKTANIYMSNYIERHYGPQGLHATSLMPGGIWTPLQKHMDPELLKKYSKDEAIRNGMKSTEQGAATTVWAAVAEEWAHKGGKYLENCQVSLPAKPDPTSLDSGYAKHAFDEEKEEVLWKDSLKMVGLGQSM